MKKLLYVSFILTLLITVFTLTATAATYGDLTYTVSNDEVTITDCSLSATSVTIPERINGYAVTSIGSRAFYNCSSITSITIPDSVTSIGYGAFENCTSLKSVTFEEESKCASIDSNAFYNTGYYNNTNNWKNNVLYIGNHLIEAKTSISGSYEIRQGTKIIADEAFSNCRYLTSIAIPNSITNIGSYAFSSCTSLTSVTIPDSVTSIGSHAFSGCTALTSITIPDSVTSIGDYAFYNTGYYNNSNNWKNNVLYIGNYLIETQTSISGSYEIRQGTKIIADEAFSNCRYLTSIAIPNSITNIGSYAFSSCTSLTSISIPDSVTSIGEAAFSGCDNLKAVHITDIETWCNISFGGSYANPLNYAEKLYLNEELVTDLVIPDGVTSIGDYAFSDCTSLTSITIPDSVTSIGGSAFYNCTSLKEVHITDIETWCNISFGYENSIRWNYSANPLYYADNGLYIDGKPIISVTLPDSVANISAYAFHNCKSLTSVTIADSVTSIGDYAFYNCESLVKVKISKESRLISIGESVFENCSSLSQMTFPKGLQSIGWDAFENCISIHRVDIYDITSWCTLENEGYNFFPYDNEINLYYNGELLEELVIPDGITKIREYAFLNCMSIRTVKIPTSVTCIGIEAFDGCYNINKLYIDDIIAWCNVDIINESEEYAYRWNEGNTELTSANLYMNNELVEDLIIPEGVTTIKKGAFYGCNSIKTIEFPKSVQSIQAYAFANSFPQKVTISSSTAFIASTAFSHSETKFHGFIGTYTEEFAELKGYTFVPLDEVVYEIKYNLAGGEGQLETGKKGVYADYYITSTIPTKLHCTFLGWSTEEVGEVEYKAGDVYSANSDLTLFAVWQEPQLIVEDLTTSIGNEFTLPVVVKNNPGIAGMNLQITLPEGIDLISVDKGTALSSLTMTAGNNLADSPYTILWDGVTADTSNGTIVTLTLKVAKTASEGDYNVKIAVDAADKDLVDIEIPDVTVTVTAKNYIPGDSNGDNEVNFRDVIIIRSLIVNGLDSIDCNKEALDVNRDGELNFRDVILIRQYIVGGYGIVLK